MYISPSVADSRPAMHRRVVVLPQPEGPRRTTNSLSFTSRSSPLTARVPSYDFVSPRNETRAKETLDGQERINNLRLPLLAVAPRMTDFHGRSSRRGETPVRLSRDYRGPGVRRDPRPREQVERKAGRARERDRIRRRRRRVAAQPRPLAAGCRSGRALVRPRRVERLLHRDEDDAQRASRLRGRADAGHGGHVSPFQRAERGRIPGRVRLRHHPRSAAGSISHSGRAEREVALALPPRPHAAERIRLAAPRPPPRGLRRGGLQRP